MTDRQTMDRQTDTIYLAAWSVGSCRMKQGCGNVDISAPGHWPLYVDRMPCSTSNLAGRPSVVPESQHIKYHHDK